MYALLDVDGRPRYVGHSKDPAARVSDHWRQRGNARVRRGNPAFCEWLGSLDSRPGFRVIAQVAYADRYEQEHFYTERLRGAGADLLNINSGAHLSAEHRARLFAASQAPEALAKLRRARRGRMGVRQTPEWIAKRVATTRARRLAREAA